MSFLGLFTFRVLNMCKPSCIKIVALLIASDYQVKYAFNQNLFLSHTVWIFLNIYYRNLITLKMLDHETQVTQNIIPV